MNKPTIHILPNYDALSQASADLIAATIAAKPHAALVVATGDTPMGAYRVLTERRQQGLIDPTKLQIFQLDAYCGLAADDRRALIGWTMRSFVEPLGISPQQVVRLPGDATDPQAACAEYATAVAGAGGFDLAILGLGPNGHLGFNEPPSHADSPTRMVALTEESLVSNARYWGGREYVPTHALTCGMDLLLAARQIILIVSGAHKHGILQRTLHAPPTPDVPASWLQQAANVTVFADQAAWHGGSSGVMV
jgi:glucosamine-6-phosphate deaminase